MDKAKKILGMLNEEVGTLVIRIDTDTLQDNPNAGVVQVLKGLIGKLDSGEDLHYIELKDAKGNIVGSAEFED